MSVDFGKILTGEAPKIALKIEHHESPVPLMLRARSGRELVRLTHDHRFVFAEDLTLAEAQDCIESLIREVMKHDA